jgi:ribonuclease P protein component
VQRLKTREQFQAVLAGSTVARTAHFVMHGLASDVTIDSSASPQPAFPRPGQTWIGAMVPKRWARRAVTRNLIKRQIYAVSAGFEPQLPSMAFVVRLRAGFDRSRFVSASSDQLKQAVRAELDQLFTRLASSSKAGNA